jgi:ABC-type antimicrobial peptide transport system permease subunit
VQEGLILAFLSTLPGVLVALWVLAAQHTAQHTLLALIVVLVIVFVSALATIPALRAIHRMKVVDVLRTE